MFAKVGHTESQHLIHTQHISLQSIVRPHAKGGAYDGNYNPFSV